MDGRSTGSFSGHGTDRARRERIPGGPGPEVVKSWLELFRVDRRRRSSCRRSGAEQRGTTPTKGIPTMSKSKKSKKDDKKKKGKKKKK